MAETPVFARVVDYRDLSIGLLSILVNLFCDSSKALFLMAG
jgi:hypothetical protein